jgi:hypothetical protein
MMPE